jgi:hypothetical protein
MANTIRGVDTGNGKNDSRYGEQQFRNLDNLGIGSKPEG